MDRRERSGQAVTAMLAAFDGLQSVIWTALPGIIQEFNAVKQTARILPGLQVRAQNADGSFVNVTIPELLDCPVQFAAGGGVSLTFPIKQGDECLVVFSSRCIDNWWQKGSPGGIVAQEQAEFRMHSLSDGFCIPGVSSVPRVVTGISTMAAQLRTDDGETLVEVDPAGAVTVRATAEVLVVAPQINLIGEVNVTGNLNVSGITTGVGDVIGAGISLSTHLTSAVTPGGGTSGTPI